MRQLGSPRCRGCLAYNDDWTPTGRCRLNTSTGKPQYEVRHSCGYVTSMGARRLRDRMIPFDPSAPFFNFPSRYP